MRQDWWFVEVVRKLPPGKDSHWSQKVNSVDRMSGAPMTHPYLSKCGFMQPLPLEWGWELDCMNIISMLYNISILSYKERLLWLWRSMVPYCKLSWRGSHGRKLMMASGKYLTGNWSPQSSIHKEPNAANNHVSKETYLSLLYPYMRRESCSTSLFRICGCSSCVMFKVLTRRLCEMWNEKCTPS